MNHAWTCRCCGKQFATLPLDFVCEAPLQWGSLNEEDRLSRGQIDSDRCRIDNDFFLRGCLEIPLLGMDEKFVWGVWVSVSEPSFRRVLDLWDAADVSGEPAKFGWFCNDIPGYPTTLGLKTNLHLRNGGIRPFVQLEPTDHPLAVDQRRGISLARVEEIIAGLATHH
jgi:hypothetical protein